MARLPRLCPAGVPLHIVQRGSNRQVCFVCDSDYRSYLRFLKEGSVAYGVAIHAWVLMSNHVHILATSHFDGSISKMMQYVGRYYVREFNYLYRRSGTLWEGRFKSCVVDSDAYFLTCHRYIELNPVRAGMVVVPEKYPWSSYHHNGEGVDDDLVTPGESYLALGATKIARLAAYRNLFEKELSPESLTDLRDSTSKGLAFGGSKFKGQVEELYQRRVRSEKPGPKEK